MKSQKRFYFLIIVFAIFLNCNSEKPTDDGRAAALLLLSDGGGVLDIQINAGPVGSVVTVESNGTYTSVVNASSSTQWVYVSLANNGIKVNSSDIWDLKFQRMNIGTYSGTSVSGGNGGACTTGSTNFSENFTGNECVKSVDENMASSGGGGGNFSSSVNPVLSAPLDLETRPPNSPWYTYSSESHVLNSRNFVYIITGNDGSKYILKILDYYSTAGTSGVPKITWKKI